MTGDDEMGRAPGRPTVDDDLLPPLRSWRQPTDLQPVPAAGAGSRRQRWAMRSAIGLTVLLLAIVLSGATRPASDEPGWLTDSIHQAFGAGDTGRPTPRSAPSRVPLGAPTPSGTQGPHAFMAVQDDGVTPVAYDPCRPIPYVVNARTAPPGGDQLVAEAVAEISRVTGLRFVDEGTTDEAPGPGRRSYQPHRYGDRWSPVLIAWSDPGETPVLDGGVAGIGGSMALRDTDSGLHVYVTGEVILDGPQLARMMHEWNGRAATRAVLIHELAHVVGLGHVEERDQLMYEGPNAEVTRLQGGDLEGLEALGAGPCIGRL